jgi:ribosome biogenesis protein SSF1/2
LQRVVLFSADPATGLISLRHYTISTAPSGVKKPLKALVLRQAVPDMGGLQDVADLITKSGYGSVSGCHAVWCALSLGLGFALCSCHWSR